MKEKLDSIKNSSQEILRNTASLLFTRKVLLLVITVVVLVILAIIPEIYLSTLLNKKETKAAFKSYIRKHNAYISFDDISLSFYRGIIIYNLEIASDFALTKGQPVLKAERVQIDFSRSKFFQEKKIIFNNIAIEGAHWSISVSQNGKQDNLIPLIGHWSNSKRHLTISMPESTLQLTFKRAGYLKKEIVIDNANIKLKKETASLAFDIDFKSRQLGEHNYNHVITFCRQKKCKSAMKHRSIWMFKNLDNKLLSWWSDKFLFSSKTTNGKVIFEKFSDNRKVEADLQLIDFTLKNKKQQKFTQIHSLKAKIKLQKKKSKIKSETTGTADGYSFKLNYQSKDNTDWPENFSANITRLEKSAKIHLFEGITLLGLEKFFLKIAKYKNRYDGYRNLTVNTSIKQGKLLWKNTVIKIPQLVASLKKEKSYINADFILNQSDLHFEHRGKINNKRKKYRPVIDPFEDSYESISKIRIITFRFSGHGLLQSHNLYLSDFQSLSEVWAKKMKLAIKKRLKKHRFKPRLLQRQWFHRFFREAYITSKIKLDNVKIKNDSWHNITGELKMGIPKFTIELADLEKNEAEIIWFYGASNPWLQVDIHTILASHGLQKNWFVNSELIQSFAQAKLSYKFKGYGEYLADLYRTARSSMNVKAEQVIFGPAFKLEIQGEHWQLLQFTTKRDGRKGKLKIVRARNGTKTMYAQGVWQDKNFKPNYRLQIK